MATLFPTLPKPTFFMLRWFFRIALLLLGLAIVYWFGGDAAQAVSHRVTGTTVEGQIVGFLAGRGTSIQPESTGVRKGKRRARRPVFRYPVAAGSTDSLTAKSSTGAMFTFSQYELGEPVTVVFSPSNPQNARIFGFQTIFVSLLVALLGLYMIFIGVTGRLG